MDWTNPAFLIPGASSPFYIIAGVVMYYYPPTKINSLYGYRTPRSIKSQQRWNFAQIYSSKQMVIWGAVMLIAAILASFIELKMAFQFLIGLGILFLFTAIPIIKTEHELKQRYRN
jgi:uncharacterized membrane protein